MENKEINNLLYKILEHIKVFIPDEYYNKRKELIYVGEPGIALQCMCSDIDDEFIPITEEIYANIELAGTAMKMDPNDTWTFVREHVVRNA